MTMSITFNENADFSQTNITYDDVLTFGEAKSLVRKTKEVPLFAEKLRAPKLKDYVPRPRLNELLAKFSVQIGATLVTGRAGTGKTALAADFARNYSRVAWYQVGAADSALPIFARYFCESMKRAKFKVPNCDEKVSSGDVQAFLESIFIPAAKKSGKSPALIVLDDVHHIFDADWFGDFFGSLLYLLTPQTHLLLLARATPDFPLWRLRSKQVLGVIDEDLLLFNFDEAKKFFAGRDLAPSAALKNFKESFGRIGKLIDLSAGDAMPAHTKRAVRQ
jgi:ATP/maltotriose-dependent transcriptional regulator MalT